MAKKIGLLSVYNHNYGSILQAYALQEVLRRLGYNTEIIKYKKTNMIKQAKRLLFIPLLKATVKMKWKTLYCKFFKPEIYKEILATRELAFSKFIRENLHFSEVYRGRGELEKSCSNYDCFVLGSDQVWNPMNLGGDFYTMTFIPDAKLKITYAPSFGVSNIPKKQREKTRAYLDRIEYISVREKDGVNIVKELTGREVTMVVDPTILIDRKVWDEKKGERLVKEDYIFCYYISDNAEYRKFAQRLSEKTGLRLVSIPHVDEYVKADDGFGDVELKNVGPIEFVNLVSNAEYVCTDSFHGTVFSTLYQRTFFTFSRYINDNGDSTNSRLYSFLELIDMRERMYRPDHVLTSEDLETLDFTLAYKNIFELRNSSMEYLMNSLNEEK